MNLPEKAKFNLCSPSLWMPTEIVGQNGAVIKQSTKIALQGCKTVKSSRPEELTPRTTAPKRLTACRKQHKHSKARRVACEKRVRKRYAARKSTYKARERPTTPNGYNDVAGVSLENCPKLKLKGSSARSRLALLTTHRTSRVLGAISITPPSNNREITEEAGLSDECQTLKLLARLERQGLIENVGLAALYDGNRTRDF